MDAPVFANEIEAARASLLRAVSALIPKMQVDAERLDREFCFPREEIAALREIGALSATLPVSLGGLGLGTEPEGARALFDCLRLIGRGNLSLGRLYEGHVNAVALVALYGTVQQRRNLAEEVLSGHLFAIWNTEGVDGLRASGSTGQRVLTGAKLFCSGAGQVTRAVVTACMAEGGTRLAVVSLDRNCRIEPMNIVMQGMRAALLGRVVFEEMPISPDAFIGASGDYLKEPAFSGGAWRTSAVTLGGLEALTVEMGRQLKARGRHADSHQQARFGHMLIACETAALWAWQAASKLEAGGDADPGGTVAYVNLARIAVETAAMEAIRLAQRSLGLAAFLHPNPVERIARDLGTYLRQPAPDETLTEAASWYFRHDCALTGLAR